MTENIEEPKSYNSWRLRCSLKDVIKNGRPLSEPTYIKVNDTFHCKQSKHLWSFDVKEKTEICTYTSESFYELYVHFNEAHASTGEHLVDLCVLCQKIYETSTREVCSRVHYQRILQADLNGCSPVEP